MGEGWDLGPFNWGKVTVFKRAGGSRARTSWSYSQMEKAQPYQTHTFCNSALAHSPSPHTESTTVNKKWITALRVGSRSKFSRIFMAGPVFPFIILTNNDNIRTSMWRFHGRDYKITQMFPAGWWGVSSLSFGKDRNRSWTWIHCCLRKGNAVGQPEMLRSSWQSVNNRFE